MTETKLKQQSANTVTGKINFTMIPANGYTTGANNNYWSGSYGMIIICQAQTSLNHARSFGISMPSDVDLTGNLVFKFNGEIGTSATMTPIVIIGYARNGGISAITGFNNDTLSGISMTTTITTYTLATIAGSNFAADDTVYIGLTLKSSYNVSIRSVWMEYTKKPLA